eukprot:364918-Chlamydomonas_euryale.AAC.15
MLLDPCRAGEEHHVRADARDSAAALAGEQHRAHANMQQSKALPLAVIKGHADIVETLLDWSIVGEAHRAHAAMQNSYALKLAGMSGRECVARLLLDPASQERTPALGAQGMHKCPRKQGSG